MTLSQIFRNLVEKNLSCFVFENAYFYAERLFYENPSPENLNILAQCYYRNGKLKQTYLLLKESTHAANRYLYALSCIGLKKYKEAENALLLDLQIENNIDPHRLTETEIESIPGNSTGLYLLGIIARKEQRKEIAIAYFQRSLDIDPTSWSCIVQLSEMGVTTDANKYFSVSDEFMQRMKSSKTLSTSHAESASSLIDNVINSNYDTTANRKSHSSTVYSRRKSSQSLEIRKLAESTQDVRYSGGASLSLGLSSLAMRMPFASPGPIPSPHTTNDLFDNCGSPSLFASSNNANNSDIHTYSQHPYPIVQIDSQQIEASSNQPRALFEMSNNTTITPLMNSFSINNFPSESPAIGTRPGGHPSPRNSNYNRYSHAHSTIEPQTGTYSTFRGTLMHESHTAYVESQLEDIRDRGYRNRRVSFGPTARLSFSSMGVGGLEKEADESLEPKLGRKDGNSKSMGTEISDSETIFKIDKSHRSNTETGGDIHDDEYPQKVYRLGRQGYRPETVLRTNESKPIYDQIDQSRENTSLLMSPILSVATPQTNPFGNMLHHIPSVDRTRLDDSLDQQNQQKQQQKLHSQLIQPPLGIFDDNGNAFERHTGSAENPKTCISNQKTNNEYIMSYCECEEFCEIMNVFSTAYQYLCMFASISCIETLKLLPPRHFFSGFVYQAIGKAYYEICDYKSALVSLKEMTQLEPHRVQGTEILSTVLWHLKKEKDLCTLAQQIVELDKFAPETWCVIGNCFSLQKEPDVAIRYFQRALQLDSSFTYAHTLCGHELVSNEDLEKAVKSFRTAIFHDDRHYNAWYGLGSIYYRQEKYELAEYHFRKALSINSASSVLKCFLSIVLLAQGDLQGTYSVSTLKSESTSLCGQKIKEALEILTNAVAVDPNNPQLRFQRAHVLMSVLSNIDSARGGDAVMNKSSENVPVINGRTYAQVVEEAVEELERVREMAPREPPVFVMLAQIYQKQRRTAEAIRHYNVAIDLDPKESAGIKAILDTL